ncbi:unnamed protein product [Alopecurus aequalis]
MVDPLTLSGAAWGISIAGWIISPVMTKLVNKALSYIKPGKSKDKLHELLTHTLPRLALTLEAAEGSPYMDLFEKLVGDLKSAFYELEDMLDNVEYVLHEKQLAGQKKRKWMIFASRHDAVPSDQGVNIHPSISQSLNSMLNENMKKIKELIGKAQETIELANLPCHNISSKNRPNVTATYTQKPNTADPVDKVTGRDEDRLRIIKMLRDTEGEEANAISSGGKCFSVIGICGIAGSGKTTLAQYVCQSERTAGYFDLVMWIHVSQNFSVETIYREMFEVASHKQRLKSNSLDGLKKELENKLCGKRFLLVLDDIWSDNDVADQQLPLLLSPFKVGRRGSKVLVTSRNADAVSDLGRNRYTTIPIQDLDDKVFFEVLMYYALGDSRVDDIDQKELHIIGTEIAHKLRRSPLAARTVGGQLRRKQNVEFWRRVRDSDLLKETMGALVLSYQYLDGHLKRCFAYCSIFPRRHRWSRDVLVKMWAAEGFVRCTNAEDTEDVCQEFFDELVSASFLQLRVKEELYEEEFYIVHDLLHDLAEKVAGSDCFRIDNGWTGEVPRDVRHLFVETGNGWAIIDKIVKLKKLRTLIILAGQNNNNIISEETIKKVFTKLRKLRVLDMRSEMDTSYKLSFPDSFGNLKHLRYLSFFSRGGLAALTLPGTIAKLYHLQVLSFSGCHNLVLSSKEDMTNLTNLRILKPVPVIPNIGRMTCLQELGLFRVMKEQGYELQQLKNLNKLERNLVLEGLELVGSKEEALEAKLSDKERLRVVIMAWGNNTLEVQADVLEGLCPPRFLEVLEIRDYQGLRAPDWTVGNMKGENYLQSLWLNRCSRLGPALELVEYFVHLREFILTEYNGDTLPNNIEHLKSLVVLCIQYCLKIRSLPVLPQSLKRIEFWGCDEVFMRSCETSGDPNWHKIKHVRSVGFEGREMRTGTIETKSSHWKQYLLDDDNGNGRRWPLVIRKPSCLLYICILTCFISWLWLRHERTLKMSWMDASDV